MFIVIFLIILLTINSCDLIDYHPYDGKTDGYYDINAKAIDAIERDCFNKDTIRFIWMGDTQRWYDETVDFVNKANSYDNLDFVMHGGDISDFGMTIEFDWVHRIMKKLNVPYVALIGNHDIIGNGMSIYNKMYGDENFSFVAGNTRFLCLNTNALEFDYSKPVPDFNYIKSFIDKEDDKVERSIVAMHTSPFSEQFNNNVSDIFQYYINNLTSLQFCMNAHDHSIKIRELFDDGITYYGCACMKARSFFLYTLTPDGYEMEIVEF